jgi:hypothetical protein
LRARKANLTKLETRDAGDDQNSAGNDKGQDPSVVDDKGRKLTGTGVPGSHSALFGLTRDGHKENAAEYGSSKPKPAHSEEDSTAASGDGATFTGKSRDETTSTGDTGSRAPEGSGVQEQLNDPRVAEKGHGGHALSTEEEAGKPGGGSSVTGPSQGTGQVGQDA